MSSQIVKALYNGEEIQDNVNFPLLHPLIEYGQGCFETMLIQPNNSIFEKQAHLNRLFKSVRMLQIPLRYTKEQVSSWIAKMQLLLVKGQAYKLKIIYSTDMVLIYTLVWQSEIIANYTLLPLHVTRNLAAIKSTSYIDCILAKKQAEKQGYSDALLLNQERMAIETTIANLFWWEDGKLYSVTKQSLPGIMQQAIGKYYKYIPEKQGVSLERLKKADGVFITNALRGIIPISAIKKHRIKQTEATTKLQKKLACWQKNYSS